VVLDLLAEGIPRLELFAAFAGFVVAFVWALGGGSIGGIRQGNLSSEIA
jgi:hypothetical protein